jgi:integrase
MPAEPRGSIYKLKSGAVGIRYRDAAGQLRRKSPFSNRTAARDWFREQVAPELRGEAPSMPATTLSEFIETYLMRHSANVRPRTIATLRERLRHAVRDFGDVPLHELERMTDEVAAWQSRQPDRVRYARLAALRQVFAAAQRWGYVTRNPAQLVGRNRQPSPRAVRVFTPDELAALSAELSPAFAAVPAFVAATGLRPGEWAPLTRADVDRRAGILTVARTVSAGDVVELGKTARSLRQVPLSRRALTALDAAPPRLDTALLFPAATGAVIDLDNFRRRQWGPAVEASGVPQPARIYDLRSTFASNALAAGVGIHALARIMGTSVLMVERHYGTLLDGAMADLAGRLDAFDVDRESAAVKTLG